MTAEPISFRVALEEAGERIDAVLTRRVPGLSRSIAATMIKTGRVTTDGLVVDKPSLRVRGDELIAAEVPPPEPTDLQPADIALRILYEDDWIFVIDKPAGLVVHPARGHRDDTMVNALIGRQLAPAPVGEPFKPGIVHRLDKDTSGCLVVAKTAAARVHLEAEFHDRRVGKRYLAVVHGRPASRGSIDAPIGRDSKNRKRMAVCREGGRESLSRYRVVERFTDASLIEVEIATGRTHQIRVHLASLGHPVVGDALYGGGRRGRGPLAGFPRQALHSAELRFRHPGSGDEVVFSADLPTDMLGLLQALRGSPTAAGGPAPLC